MPRSLRVSVFWRRERATALVYAAFALAVCPTLSAQSGGSYLITTVAGTGSQGFSCDNGLANFAQLNDPYGVAVDSAGNLYIADQENNCIRKVADGVIATVAGNGTRGFSGDGGPATGAQLWVPQGVTVDSAGNLYISDMDNHRIRRVSNGVITTVAGNGTAGFSGDGGPATSAQLQYPQGIAVDYAGNLYIADTGNRRIRKVSKGVITTVAGNGWPGYSGDNGPATSAMFFPSGIAVDSASNLYISDSGSERIRKVSNGVITTVAGNGTAGFSGDGGPATSAGLWTPQGVTVDSAGNLYIADQGNHRIRKVSNGVITTVAGGGSSLGDGGPATSAQLDPEGVAVDASGNLFVAEPFGDASGNLFPAGSSTLRIRKLVVLSQSTLGCQYAIDHSAQNFGASGGSASVIVAASYSCPWLVANSTNWITITSDSIGPGNGVVTFTVVAPNTNRSSRTGTIWIAGLGLTVSQSGVTCALAVSPRNVSVAAAGVTGGSLTVTSNAPDCFWTAIGNGWIVNVSSTASGSGGINGSPVWYEGSGTVTYTVSPNTGGLRTGTITVAGQAVYVNQAAAGSSVSTLAAVNASGVVNAASYAPPIAPGGFISVYGQNLADVTTDWSSAITNGKLPTSLGGVQVLVNGKNAYTCYVQSTQVNALAQPDTATGLVEVDVITNHGTVVATASMATLSPALFTYSLQGTVYAAAQFATDYAYVAPNGALPGASSRPAKPGDNILLYATGLGQTNPAYPVGQVLTTAYPIADLSQISVWIGGQPAPVQFAGMTYAGLFQINIQVPNGVPSGNQPVVIQIGGQSSQSAVVLTVGP